MKEGTIVGDFASEDWGAQWGKLQSWLLATRFFRETLKLGEGGDTGHDHRIAEQTFRRTGVSIMGKRMFDLGERMWPQEAPFHTPAFVLTSQVREPWMRPGGTTFYFVNDGIESALHQARAVAGDRDIRIAGGANVIQQYLRAGLVDEFSLAISPVIFGGGSDCSRASAPTSASSSSRPSHRRVRPTCATPCTNRSRGLAA